MLHLYQGRNRAKMPAATKSRNRITPIIRSRRARSSCPGLGIEIPMKEINIQKSERWGSCEVGFSEFGPEAAGSISSTITRRFCLGFQQIHCQAAGGLNEKRPLNNRCFLSECAGERSQVLCWPSPRRIHRTPVYLRARSRNCKFWQKLDGPGAEYEAHPVFLPIFRMGIAAELQKSRHVWDIYPVKAGTQRDFHSISNHSKLIQQTAARVHRRLRG